MPKLSAGVLLYRIINRKLEVLLVHPGGPFWAKKDAGAWSLPKGEYLEGEEPWAAAQREFREETGQSVPTNEPLPLGEVKYNNKVLTAWAIEGDLDVRSLHSNLFSMEWPLHSGTKQEFPEVDRGEWCSALSARTKLVDGQVEFISRLEDLLHIEPPVVPPTQTSFL